MEASVIISQWIGQAMARRKESDAQKLVRFFVRSGRLKAERRRGWVKKLGLTNPESVADHSYRTALMSMVISDSRKLDTEKVMRLALLHDLPEAFVGDAMPEERSGKRKIVVETKAMEELLNDLPPGVRALYREAWQEFVIGESEESRLVRQLDKLEMAIQAWEYVQESGDPASAREFLATAKEHVGDEVLVELLRQVEF
jgi:putative hydrolase of HD superfamily